jgi:hypothetical protein
MVWKASITSPMMGKRMFSAALTCGNRTSQ